LHLRPASGLRPARARCVHPAAAGVARAGAARTAPPARRAPTKESIGWKVE